MNQLSKRLREACVGHPHAKIEWPHRILHEAADLIDTQARKIEEQANRIVRLENGNEAAHRRAQQAENALAIKGERP